MTYIFGSPDFIGNIGCFFIRDNTCITTMMFLNGPLNFMGCDNDRISERMDRLDLRSNCECGQVITPWGFARGTLDD